MSDRISQILREQKLKHVNFAKTLGISANYVSLLVNGRKENISLLLAKLIESTYGYRAEWVMMGEEPIHAPSNADIREAAMDRLQQMDAEELSAVAAYIWTLDNVRADEDLDKPDKPSVLSAAQRRVYDLYAQGCNVRQISEALGISANTIKTHSRHIYKKLGVKSRSELLEWKGGGKE
jgi:DNA-binding CsgD family transcriptional regulator/plasmid maintenance system antidote protein VapI